MIFLGVMNCNGLMESLVHFIKHSLAALRLSANVFQLRIFNYYIIILYRLYRCS